MLCINMHPDSLAHRTEVPSQDSATVLSTGKMDHVSDAKRILQGTSKNENLQKSLLPLLCTFSHPKKAQIVLKPSLTMPGGPVPPIELVFEWQTGVYPHGIRAGPVLTIVSSVFCALAVGVVFARIYDRIFIRHNYGLDDTLIIVAAVSSSMHH